jgi:hypothetical protein
VVWNYKRLRTGLALMLMLTALPCAAAPAAAIPAAPDASLRQLTLSLKDLGYNEPIPLKGVDGRVNLAFGVRLDETVASARLKLHYSYSPALIPELSHLKLLLNGEVIAAIPLPREQAGTEVVREVELDPRYFTDYNTLAIQLVGHYTRECEDAMHSSLWASISNQSSIELSLRPLALQTGLSLLPAPFFDRRDNRRLDLPFVFAAKPSFETLRAAGVVASWFGAEASYRSARFPALYDVPPSRNAVVFATNTERPQGLHLPQVQVPTVSVIDNPADPAIKLLLIQGRDAAQLQTAADALVLGQVVLSGRSATVNEVKYEPRRLAYDAPGWINTERAVKLGELVGDPTELQAIGHLPSPIRVNVKLPPDLLTWNRRGVPLDLKYRYTPPIGEDNSSLTVSINNSFVQAFRLRPSGKGGDKSRLLVPVLDDSLAQFNDQIVIPAFQVGSNNQLQFQFALDYHKQGQCADTVIDAMRSAIDPDSTIDLTPFPHYTAMPNLALFANAGFPFTKYADLAETAVVLPDQPQASDVEAMLFMLGRLGRVTGIPGLRFQLTHSSAAASVVDSDLLVIGGPAGKDLLAQWGKSLPAIIEQNRRAYTPLARIEAMPGDLLGDRYSNLPSTWRLDVAASGPLAALLGFESPLKSDRSVIAVAASSPEIIGSVIDALEDEGRVGRIRGDVSFVRGKQIDSFQVGGTYYVGYLPLRLRIWFFLSQHPVLLALFGIIAGLILAFLSYWLLRGFAARRMEQ